MFLKVYDARNFFYGLSESIKTMLDSNINTKEIKKMINKKMLELEKKEVCDYVKVRHL